MSVMRECLRDLDVARARQAWADVAPGFPQPESDYETLVCLHMARTSAQSIPTALRVYSHQWLEDRDLPSQLPEELKPKQESRIVSAVGISVTARDPEMEPLARVIRNAMESGVWDAVEDGKLEDSNYVKARMAERRGQALKKLFGGYYGEESGI
jgi:hypothetical protein